MYVLCYLLYICLVTCRLNTFFFLFKFENKLRKEVRLKNIQGILFKILFKLQKAHNAEKHAIFVFGEPNPRFFFFFFFTEICCVIMECMQNCSVSHTGIYQPCAIAMNGHS